MLGIKRIARSVACGRVGHPIPGGFGMESSTPARVLVVAHKTAATPCLIQAVRERAQRSPATFTLLAPNPAHALHGCAAPGGGEEGEGQQGLALAITLLEEGAGGPVEGILGDPSPMSA